MSTRRRGPFWGRREEALPQKGVFSPTPGSIFFLGLCALILIAAQAFAADETVKLPDLIREALKNNPEINVAEARTDVSQHKIPQATSLADPMFMLGYENGVSSVILKLCTGFPFSDCYLCRKDCSGGNQEPWFCVQYPACSLMI